jgi:hypothetical protein
MTYEQAMQLGRERAELARRQAGRSRWAAEDYKLAAEVATDLLQGAELAPEEIR